MAIQGDATQLLGSIPFDSLIGGPMTAAIGAQAQAAQTSVAFIQTVGIDNDKVRTVTFHYKDGDDDKELIVPLLTIVPVPFLRIDNMTIDFKANISATTETSDQTTLSKSASASIDASAKYLFFSAKLSGSVSSKKDSTSTRSSKYAVEYTIDVNVHAVQDDMPKGLATVLGILNESIQATLKKP